MESKILSKYNQIKAKYLQFKNKKQNKKTNKQTNKNKNKKQKNKTTQKQFITQAIKSNNNH